MKKTHGWNYRIVRHRDPLPKYMLLKKNKKFTEKYHPGGYIEWFAVHEVYYTNDKPDGITSDPIRIITDEFIKKEYRWVLSKIRLAINKPVLDYKTMKEV
jgi:hypothetical protein